VPKHFALVLIPLTLLVGCGGGGGGGTVGSSSSGGSSGSGITCTAESVTTAQQLPNPVTLFATDNTGVILELPSVPDAGATDPTGGALVFGIGTESNNTVGSATLLDANTDNGELTATLNGTNQGGGYFDSGSNANFFTDSALTVCASPNQGFYCPTAASVTENATMAGTNNMSNPTPTPFNVENADTLFSNDNASYTAFNDLGGPIPSSAGAISGLDLGLPFFFGQNIYTGIEPASGASPPYFALIGNTTSGGSAAIAATGPPNVEPVIVDGGPAGLSPPTVNTPFISVKVCVPGTSTCQTIDHVEVDTGSIGLRLISTVVTISLPALKDSSNNPLAECLQFADGTSWGSLATADVTLPTSGESAKSVNVQLIGASSAGSPPSACTGTAENSVDTFGANGIIGVGPFVNDCNSSGDCEPGTQSANYYYCTGS
jgi:Protein of unknown function (DUF3443)